MEESTTPSFTPHARVRALLKDKKIRTTLAVAAIVVFVIWLLQSALVMMGVGERSLSMDGVSYPQGVTNESPYSGAKVTSSRGAMEYEDSYYPPVTPSGATGSYEEAEYETREYTAAIKTSEYDRVLAVIEGWKPLPHVIFEQANKGERTSYYHFKVEHNRADGVLRELAELTPTDLNQQTTVVKKQLLEYTSRLDVLAKQEELLTNMLDEVNAAYDELVTLSKDARDVKTLASVIDDKLKYINQLSQQRLNVSNQIDSIAQQKAELADRIAYVYFTIHVTKYEFINAQQLKDSWVAQIQKFVHETNNLFQAMTLGLLSLLLVLLQVVLYVVVVGTIALVVAKHGYRVVKKFWQS